MIIGGAIFLFGLVKALEKFGVIDHVNLFGFWPLVLIGVGLSKVIHPRRRSSRTWGIILLFFGGSALLHNLDIPFVSFDKIWPLLLIALGAQLIWRATHREPDAAGVVGISAGHLNECAAFGGGERRIDSPDFRGGDISVVFGGLQVDCRGATIVTEEAVVDAFAMFGGIELIVPASWSVRVEGFPVFGGFDDKTVHPVVGDDGSPPKRLVVRGYSMFGGVDVKN